MDRARSWGPGLSSFWICHSDGGDRLPRGTRLPGLLMRGPLREGSQAAAGSAREKSGRRGRERPPEAGSWAAQSWGRAFFPAIPCMSRRECVHSRRRGGGAVPRETSINIKRRNGMSIISIIGIGRAGRGGAGLPVDRGAIGGAALEDIARCYGDRTPYSAPAIYRTGRPLDGRMLEGRALRRSAAPAFALPALPYARRCWLVWDGMLREAVPIAAVADDYHAGGASWRMAFMYAGGDGGRLWAASPPLPLFRSPEAYMAFLAGREAPAWSPGGRGAEVPAADAVLALYPDAPACRADMGGEWAGRMAWVGRRWSWDRSLQRPTASVRKACVWADASGAHARLDPAAESARPSWGTAAECADASAPDAARLAGCGPCDSTLAGEE